MTVLLRTALLKVKVYFCLKNLKSLLLEVLPIKRKLIIYIKMKISVNICDICVTFIMSALSLT